MPFLAMLVASCIHREVADKAVPCEYPSLEEVELDINSAMGRYFCGPVRIHNVSGHLEITDVNANLAADEDVTFLPRIEDDQNIDLRPGQEYQIIAVIYPDEDCVFGTAICVPVERPVFLNIVSAMQSN